MKREIKFRAWDPVLHRFASAYDTVYIESDGEVVIVDTIGGLNQVGYDIQLFTGLKDKNGKDIYEGDIIKRYHLTGMVIYDTKRATFIMMDGFNESLSNEIYGVEVIGNIYENAELLNK